MKALLLLGLLVYLAFGFTVVASFCWGGAKHRLNKEANRRAEENQQTLV